MGETTAMWKKCKDGCCTMEYAHGEYGSQTCGKNKKVKSNLLSKTLSQPGNTIAVLSASIRWSKRWKTPNEVKEVGDDGAGLL